ncbi:MAG: LysR family transcriptional regulator [Pseudomonadota bacterium]
MNWDDAKLFLTIARSGSVRRAAPPLGLHHSTVLRRLDALERQLAVRLFERGRSYALTPAGEALRAHAEAAETALSAATAAVSRGDARIAGPIRIAAPAPVLERLLAPALSPWRARYPDLEPRLIPLDPGEEDPAAEVSVRVGHAPRDGEFDQPAGLWFEAAYAARPDRAERLDPAASGLIVDPPSDGSELSRPPWAELQGFGAAPLAAAARGSSARAALAAAGLGVAALPCILGDGLPELVRVRGPWPAGELRVAAPVRLRGAARVQAAIRFCAAALKAGAPALQGRGSETDRLLRRIGRGAAQGDQV